MTPWAHAPYARSSQPRLGGELAPAPAPAWALPIVDLRQELSWAKRLPGRFGTMALWLGSFGLLGPAKLVGVVAVFGLALPGAWLIDRCWRQRLNEATTPPAWQTSGVAPFPQQLDRAALAERFALSEAQLFRARHAAVCTLVYNEAGQLVDLIVPGTRPSAPPFVCPRPDAHPVG